MIRYIHGSEDSLDLDMYYVFDVIPSFAECRSFCSAEPSENRNIIQIDNGIVSSVFIGTPDEVNNGLLDTYSLHKQEYPLIVERRVERNVILKQIRAVRGILSILSRTFYREHIKYALKHNWSNRIECLDDIRIADIDLTTINKQSSPQDMLKVIAFQIGQGMALLDGVELYTKNSVSEHYPMLKPYLYREAITIWQLDEMLQEYVSKLKTIRFHEINADIVTFPDYDKTYELRHEILTQP